MASLNNPTGYYSTSNLFLNQNFLDESKYFETFSTYKIFTLELISIFCNIRVSRSFLFSKFNNTKTLFDSNWKKIKSKHEAANTDLANETPTLDNSLLLNQLKSKDFEFNALQILKIINIILKSIKVLFFSNLSVKLMN